MNNSTAQVNGPLILKWILLAIPTYTVIGNILNILGIGVEILIVHLTHNVIILKWVKVIYSIITTAVIVMLFIVAANYFRNKITAKFPQGYLIASLVILPFSFGLNYGVNMFTTYLYSSRFGAEGFAKMSIFNSVFYAVNSARNIVILLIFGLKYGVKVHSGSTTSC